MSRTTYTNYCIDATTVHDSGDHRTDAGLCLMVFGTSESSPRAPRSDLIWSREHSTTSWTVSSVEYRSMGYVDISFYRLSTCIFGKLLEIS